MLLSSKCSGRAVTQQAQRKASATAVTLIGYHQVPAKLRRQVITAAPCPSSTISQPSRLTTCHAAEVKPAGSSDLAAVPSTANGKLISKTEVAAFIQRDDMMDQMYQWAVIEAGEGGVRNFGLPMTVEPFYNNEVLWGYKVGIFKEGQKLCDLGIMYDQEEVTKHEWIGRGDDGFPVLEGKAEGVLGKHLEIWKLDQNPVDETLRSAIRAFCSGFVIALNRYYAFGSIFVDDAQ